MSILIYMFNIKIPINMKKFLVETYYTCTFKTVHALEDLNEKALEKIDSRTDGQVEVIDVKLNNRKTRKIGDSNKKNVKSKIEKSIKDSAPNEIINNLTKQSVNNYASQKFPTNQDLKCQIEEKDIFKKHKLVTIKVIILVNTMTEKSEKFL